MKNLLLFLVVLMPVITRSQKTDTVNINTLGAVGDGKTDISKYLNKVGDGKTILIPKGQYQLDRTKVSFNNFILDSGAVLVSDTYAPYLPGKINRKSSYNQQTYNYICYNPPVNISTVLQAGRIKFQYNHDATITYFDGYFYALWNALASGGKDNSEGTPGQMNYMSRSRDAVHWSLPVALFNDAAYTYNPLPGDPSKSQQWQPNVIAFDDRMLIIWSETGHTASYISILLKGETKVTTYRIDINLQTKAIKLNKDLNSSPDPGYDVYYPQNGMPKYFIYSTQNPYQLTTGRLLIPFSIEDTLGDFAKRNKWASFIYTDNPKDLNSFRFADLTQGSTPGAAWEPFFSEDRNGKVYMHMRNLTPQKNAKGKDLGMEVSASADGIHFNNAVPEGLDGPSTRGYCERVSNNRYMMVYNEVDNNNRINGMVEFSRLGANDFTPGVSLQKDAHQPGDVAFNYPQSIIYRDTAYVIYSAFYEPRSIMLAKFPVHLPDDSLLIIPRNRPKQYLSGYKDEKNEQIVLTGSKTFRLNTPVVVGDNNRLNTNQNMVIGAWVNKQADHNGGTLFDNRGSMPGTDYNNKGIAICTSYIGMGNAGAGVNLVANLNYNFNHYGYNGLIAQLLVGNSYIGVTINTSQKKLSVYMDNATVKDGFYRSDYYWQTIEVESNFNEGETITVDDTVYTFKNQPSGSTDIPIGASLAITCSNIKNTLKNITIAGWGQSGAPLNQARQILLAFFKPQASLAVIKSTNRAVRLYNGNFVDGPGASIGSSMAGSGLPGFAGYIYGMWIYKGNKANDDDLQLHRYLFNNMCGRFGISTKAGEMKESQPDFNLTYNSEDLLNIMKNTQEYSYSNGQLTLFANSSAGIETDGENYMLSIPFRISRDNSAADPVICTFQDGLQEYNVSINNGGEINCNGIRIKKINPKVFNTISISYKNNQVFIDDKPICTVNKRPVLFLGVYDFFAPLESGYNISYDCKNMKLSILR
jgi:hypothetical protein